MTYSPSYSDLVMGAADEYDGTLSWHTAVLIAAGHSCLDQFHIDYGVRPFCVDAGEFLVWLGYLTPALWAFVPEQSGRSCLGRGP
jgi:hypothetical protein